MVPQWIIEKKRDGGELTDGEIRDFIRAHTDGTLPDYQMAAFAMAVFFRGMTDDETTSLTDAMMRSGDVLDMSDMPLPTADCILPRKLKRITKKLRIGRNNSGVVQVYC